MRTCSAQEARDYLGTFTVPDPASRSFIQEGTVGLILLPEDRFRYNPDVGYAFEVAALACGDTGRRLLFIRIDSWDPKARAEAEPGTIDYCIPIAYDGASPRERLAWTIPFGGAWSDTREDALLVFPGEDWMDWFREVKVGLAFSNQGAKSAAFLKLQERDWGPIREFCK